VAIIDRPLAIGAGDDADPTADRPLGDLTRPMISGTWRDWLTTVDHKKIMVTPCIVKTWL